MTYGNLPSKRKSALTLEKENEKLTEDLINIHRKLDREREYSYKFEKRLRNYGLKLPLRPGSVIKMRMKN